MKKVKATIYYTGGFLGNVIKREVYLVDHGLKKYAQYNSAPYVHFIKKRCRKVAGIIKGYNPYIIILKGWGIHPQPDDAMEKSEGSVESVTISKSKHSSFDDAWVDAFNKKINPYLKRNKSLVIADYRNHNSHNTLTA